MSRDRLARPSIVSALALLLGLIGACGAPEPLNADQLVELIEWESGGEGAAVDLRIRVRRENGDSDEVGVLVVDRPDGTKVVIDSTGQTYEPTLDDFLANNNLFTSRDTIIVPRDFPNTQPSRPVDLVSMPGHVTNTLWLWWLGGGSLAVIVAVGGFLWLRSRKEAPGEPG